MLCSVDDDPEHEFKFQRPRKDEQGREDLLPRKVEQESKWQGAAIDSATFVHPQCLGTTVVAKPAIEPGECLEIAKLST
ncbi:hypothetical protein ZEAMMB73_Zm00001d032808 [Zea mays]|uniref:Uncharacterized protein n=1 Tax=Zea mays TaxID=4577 RepID=A0A1D6KU45_MAIZE|nr:hypothetical protein ZEAMMB73_Zm00001d032808 [Zea mays]